jgi:hypothetical protein
MVAHASEAENVGKKGKESVARVELAHRRLQGIENISARATLHCATPMTAQYLF